jgi:hypothetical protein
MSYLKIGTYAAALLISAAVMSNLALAKQPASPGASTISPGHEMQTNDPKPGDRGASGYSPGDEIRDARTSTPPGKSDEPGASGYAPGDSISKGKK